MSKKQVKCIECGFLAIDIRSDMIALTVNAPEKLEKMHALGMLELLELGRSGRKKKNVSDSTLEEPQILNCAKHIWSQTELDKKDLSYVDEFLNLKRKCPYFFPYSPGYTPAQHLELQRERTYRRFLIIVSLLSATVGAVIATLANLLLP